MKAQRPDRSRPMGLRHRADVQSVAYLLLVPALALLHWHWAWGTIAQLPLWALQVMLGIGVGVIHHHHCHLPMWHSRRLNRLTDAWVALLQGHPTYAFAVAHNGNHHRHPQGPQDWARTDRFWGGDSNHLAGWLWHPFAAGAALYPHFMRYLQRCHLHRRGVWRWACRHHLAIACMWLGVGWADAHKALVLVWLPQAIGLHCLLAANYFQHAHADGHSRFNHARNFTGGINRLHFNIGYHLAHHEHPRVHWSQMPQVHTAMVQRLGARLHPALQQRSFALYVVKVLLLSACVPRWRSRTLMTNPPDPRS